MTARGANFEFKDRYGFDIQMSRLGFNFIKDLFPDNNMITEEWIAEQRFTINRGEESDQSDQNPGSDKNCPTVQLNPSCKVYKVKL